MMGDGEHINNAVRTGSMDDVGTRLSFLTELYDLWSTGLDICERYDKHSVNYEEKKKELETAMKLLWFHMNKDYKTDEDRKKIDDIPANPEDIKD